jgi:hypothetical protein
VAASLGFFFAGVCDIAFGQIYSVQQGFL